MLQPCQRPISPNHCQRGRANVRYRLATGQLHASLELIEENLEHQFDPFLAVVLFKG